MISTEYYESESSDQKKHQLDPFLRWALRLFLLFSVIGFLCMAASFFHDTNEISSSQRRTLVGSSAPENAVGSGSGSSVNMGEETFWREFQMAFLSFDTPASVQSALEHSTFEYLDKNNDGVLSAEELKHFYEMLAIDATNPMVQQYGRELTGDDFISQLRFPFFPVREYMPEEEKLLRCSIAYAIAEMDINEIIPVITAPSGNVDVALYTEELVNEMEQSIAFPTWSQTLEMNLFPSVYTEMPTIPALCGTFERRQLLGLGAFLGPEVLGLGGEALEVGAAEGAGILSRITPSSRLLAGLGSGAVGGAAEGISNCLEAGSFWSLSPHLSNSHSCSALNLGAASMLGFAAGLAWHHPMQGMIAAEAGAAAAEEIAATVIGASAAEEAAAAQASQELTTEMVNILEATAVENRNVLSLSLSPVAAISLSASSGSVHTISAADERVTEAWKAAQSLDLAGATAAGIKPVLAVSHLDNDVYRVRNHFHCGGDSIEIWDNGNDGSITAEYGTEMNLSQCQRTCSAHAECKGFVLRVRDGICGFWKKGTLRPYYADGHICFSKIENFDVSTLNIVQDPFTIGHSIVGGVHYPISQEGTVDVSDGYVSSKGDCDFIILGAGHSTYCLHAASLGLPSCGQINNFEDELAAVSRVCDSRSDCVGIYDYLDDRSGLRLCSGGFRGSTQHRIWRPTTSSKAVKVLHPQNFVRNRILADVGSG